MASGEAAQIMMQVSPVVGPPISGTAARRNNVVQHLSARRFCSDSNYKEMGAKSQQLQPPPQQLQGNLQRQRRTPTTPRCPSHKVVDRTGKELASVDLCRKLFGELGSEVEQGPHGQKKQTRRCQSAYLDDKPLLEEREDCVDTVSTERSRGGHKSQEKRVDSPTRPVRHVSAERSIAKLHTAIKELRAQINVMMCDAMEAAEARLAAQFLNAIVPSYDDLRQRVGAIESQMPGVTDSLSARAHEGRESQVAEHLQSVCPERQGERLAALEEHSVSISALEQAVADLRLPLVALESKHDVKCQMMARSELMCEDLRNRVTVLELQYATVICGRPDSDVQKVINSSERRLMNELQAVRTENRERVQVLSSQLLEVRVAALRAQALQDETSLCWSKAADSAPQLTDPVS